MFLYITRWIEGGDGAIVIDAFSGMVEDVIDSSDPTPTQEELNIVLPQTERTEIQTQRTANETVRESERTDECYGDDDETMRTDQTGPMLGIEEIKSESEGDPTARFLSTADPDTHRPPTDTEQGLTNRRIEIDIDTVGTEDQPKDTGYTETQPIDSVTTEDQTNNTAKTEDLFPNVTTMREGPSDDTEMVEELSNDTARTQDKQNASFFVFITENF